MTMRLSRRAFLASTAVGGVGLTIRFPLFGAPDAAAAAAFDPSPTLTITPDGLVTVHITKAEMGQGVGTALAQIVAGSSRPTGRTSASTIRSPVRSTGSC